MVTDGLDEGLLAEVGIRRRKRGRGHLHESLAPHQVCARVEEVAPAEAHHTQPAVVLAVGLQIGLGAKRRARGGSGRQRARRRIRLREGTQVVRPRRTLRRFEGPRGIY